MNIGYTALNNALLVVVTQGRGERQWKPKKGAWHLGSTLHNVLNMRQKSWWHALSSELAQMGTGARMRLLPVVTDSCVQRARHPHHK